MKVDLNLRSRTSQLFLAGILSVPVWNLAAGYLAAPEWSRHSFFNNYFYAPLMLLSLAACITAPFFNGAHVAKVKVRCVGSHSLYCDFRDQRDCDDQDCSDCLSTEL